MAQRLTRRTFLVSAALTALPVPAFAQAKPVRIGLLTVKTGPLAAGGIQMEQGTIRFLKDRNHNLAGRKVELVVADTGGNPAGTKTKTQELVERDNVDMIFGPLAAFELLAITDYAAQAKMPVLSLAAAEDMTQRRPNPYFVRASGTSAQYMHPLADYAAKELKFKRVITIADDFAFGHEQMAGFQRVFEDAGGRVVKKLWPPLVTPDYTPYIAQIGGVDAVVQGFAGSNPLKFMKQYQDQGLKLPVLGGGPAGDEALLLYLYYNQFVSPQAVALTASAEALLMVIAGGTATLLGPIAGAALVVVVKNVASAYIERWNFVLGAIFVVIVVFMPEGLVPGTVRRWRRALAALRPRPTAAG